MILKVSARIVSLEGKLGWEPLMAQWALHQDMAWEHIGRGRGIFVGIPHRSQVSTAWAINMLHALSPYLNRVRLFTIQGHPIDVSRGILVDNALAANAEFIYFLDSDIHTQPDTLQRLLDRNAPIVTALYYRRHGLQVDDQMLSYLPENIRIFLKAKKEIGMPIFTPAIWKDFVYPDEKGNKLRSFRPVFDGEFQPGQLIEVDAVPMGCCLIKTEVFKNLPRPWFYWTLGRDASMLQGDISYPIQVRQGTHGCSEDLYFSLRARERGYRLLCDTSILVRHESQGVVGGEGRMDIVEA